MTEVLEGPESDEREPLRVYSMEEAQEALRGCQDGAVVLEASGRFDGELKATPLFEPIGVFAKAHSDYLSPYGLLNDLFMLRTFVDAMEAEGRAVIPLEDAAPMVRGFNFYARPLEIDGLVVPSRGGVPGKLFPYQQFCLRRTFALHQLAQPWNGFFVSADTGTGKTVIASAAVRELVVNRGAFDLVITFATAKMKINLARAFYDATGLEMEVPEGSKPSRFRQYAAGPPGLVLNYERCHHDLDGLLPLVQGRRVLWVLDECQRVLEGQNGQTLARKALNRLIDAAAESFVLPMSATVVKKDPLRYHDVFSLMNRAHPLGTREDFKLDYLREALPWEPKLTGKDIEDWDEGKLEGVRHRVAIQTQAVRKTDPGVREFFKDMTTEVVRVQMSARDREIYDAVVEDARMVHASGERIGLVYQLLLRAVCNTGESLLHVDSEVAASIVDHFGEKHFSLANSAKFEMVADQLEAIRDQGDKAVVFTAWTKMSLFLLERVLQKRRISYVAHHGQMNSRTAQEAQDRFKADKSITVFLSSDAGALGLNLQEAKYVLHVDIPRDYDTFKQRSDRIDRADSYLDGLTSYAFVTDNSIERRLWRGMNAARRLAAVTLGTVETINRPSAADLDRMQRASSSSLESLVFGDVDDDMEEWE